MRNKFNQNKQFKMRKSLLIFGFSSLLSAGAFAQIAFTENFNALTAPAIPTGWASNPTGVWKSGAPNTIAPNAQTGLGYNLNATAYMNAFGVDGSQASANNSTVQSATFALPSTMTDASFFFDIAYFKVRLNSDASKREQLNFMISTDGGTNWTTLDSIAPNQNYVWETKSINLASYIGNSNLKVGFNYKNNGGALVGVVFDNFKIFSGKDMKMVSAKAGSSFVNGKGYQLTGTSAQISGTVQNLGTANVPSYVVKYKQGSNAAQSFTVNTAIAPLATYDFTHSIPLSIAANQEYPLQVWVELPGDLVSSNDTVGATVVGVPFMPVKRILFEEGTGTWCGWCPRGAVAMEEFAHDFPGKAAMVAVHNGDGMKVTAYDNYMASINGGGFPNLVTDRDGSYTTDPSNVEDLYNALKDNFGFAEVTLGTPAVSGSTVTVPVTIKPAINITNPRLSLIVTESNVHSSRPNTGNQTNYYANNANGAMGGWESKGSSVSNVNYHFVGRAVSPSPAGDAMGLPATLTANTTYTANMTATLNSEWQTANLQYIVTLGDASGKTIFNTDFTPMPILQPGLPSSVVNVEAGINKASLFPNPVNGNITNLLIDAVEGSEFSYSIVDLTGREVLKGKTTNIIPGENTIQVNTSNLNNGLYIVNLITEKGNASLKFQVIK